MKELHKIIAICNQKGGVTKTTSTVNLGIGLAMAGKKVLLVDCDTQANLTTALGWPEYQLDPNQMTLSNVLAKTIDEADFDHHAPMLRHNEGVDLIPSNIGLASMELGLMSVMSREYILRYYTEKIARDYDYILLDCPPSLSLLTINALAASNSVIIPVTPEYLPAIGMTQLMNSISNIQKHINPSLRVEGILLAKVDLRLALAKQVSDRLRNDWGSVFRVYDTIIPSSTKAAESSAAGMSIIAYDKHGKAALAYAELTKEVMGDAQRTKSKSSPAR